MTDNECRMTNDGRQRTNGRNGERGKTALRVLLRFPVGPDLQLRYKIKVHDTHGIIGLEDNQGSSAGGGRYKVRMVDGDVSAISQVHHERSEGLCFIEFSYSLDGHVKISIISPVEWQARVGT